MALIQDPAQRAVLDRVTAVMSLVEGHAEYVMDGVGPDVVPTVRTLRKRFAQRRKGRGPLDRVMRRLLGLEQKMKQYAEGRVFVGGVIDLVGMEGFNRVWEGPRTCRGSRSSPPRLSGWSGCWAARPSPPDPMVGPPRAVAVVRTAVREACARPAAGAGRVQRGSGLRRPGRRAGVRGPGRRGARGRRDRRPRPAAALRGAGREDRRSAARPLDPVLVLRVSVGTDGGPEGAARSARYDALAAAAEEHGARIALGHTLDDQAETVLLGLGRGSRPRSVARMVEDRPPYWRPLLGVRRETTRQACADQGLPVWDDPGTTIPPTRGCGCAPRCCRCWRRCSAGVWPGARPHRGDAAEDLDALDELAATELAALAAASRTAALPAEALGALPAALRRRVLRGWLGAAGVPDLQAVHLRAVDALVAGWRGQGRSTCRAAQASSGRLAGCSCCPLRSAAADCLHPTISRSPRVTEPASTPAGLGPDHGYGPDIDHVLLSEEQIQAKIGELAEQVARDYRVGRCCSSACSRAPSSS